MCGPIIFMKQLAPLSELDFGKECCEHCSDIGAMDIHIMYSPKIAKHTPRIYRIARAVGKPMTRVADDLISFGYLHLKSIYGDMDDEEICKILQTENDRKFKNRN